MLQVTLEKHAVIDLLGCLEELEICDESGQVMARLIPNAAYRQMMYDRAWEMFPPERIEAARQQHGKGRTLAEIMADLEARNGPVHGDVESPGGKATGPALAGCDGS